MIVLARGLASREDPRTLELPAQAAMLADLVAVSRDAYAIHRWFSDLDIRTIRVAPGRHPVTVDPPGPRSAVDRLLDESPSPPNWRPETSSNYADFWRLYVVAAGESEDGAKLYSVRSTPHRRALALDEPPLLVDLAAPGNRLLRAGNPRAALAAYLEARRKAYDLPALAFGIGECHMRLGSFDMAARAYEEAVSFAGPSAGLYDRIGQAYRRMNRPREASVAFERAAGFDPENAGRWAKAARALEEAGAVTAARSAARRALARDPGNRAAAGVLERIGEKPQ